ncbi:hypothetical protein PSQ90_01445 [Devosia rhodophyticola]|uniref:DUF302 domain-containing protein n=1 Tax=Devosia rhodophyticola TaxID=3026423 RepID=A0ABY7YY32_9HYPH|nr:hypothetical protein [Devosia rhodophyticola]WDR06151.1 hypothetical protein PSQ90_01445 [Devosia rhodophyticola]
MMDQQFEIRLEDFPTNRLRQEILTALDSRHDLSGVTLAPQRTTDAATSALADPSIVIAMISGGTTVLAALMPLIVGIFVRKSDTPSPVVIVFHGTGDSREIASESISKETLDKLQNDIGSIVGAEIRS